MKMQENILEKVRSYEYKKGISYEKTDGPVYKRFRVCYFLVFAFTMVINIMILFGDVVFDTLTFSKSMLTTVLVFTAVLVGALVLVLFKKNIWTHIAFVACDILSGVGLCLIFSKVLRDEVGVLLSKFFYCHLVPLCLLSLLAAILALIAIRAEIKTRKVYKRIVEELYKQNFAIEDNNLSEKDWNMLLKNI